MKIKVDVTYSRMFDIEVDCDPEDLDHVAIMEAISKQIADEPNDNDNLEWCGTQISDEDDIFLAEWS